LGFRWTADGGLLTLPLSSAAWDVSSDGAVVAGDFAYGVSLVDARLVTGAYWVGINTPTGLEYLATKRPTATARALSADGSVIGGMSVQELFPSLLTDLEEVSTSVRWSDDGLLNMTPAGYPIATLPDLVLDVKYANGNVTRMSDDGSVLVGSAAAYNSDKTGPCVGSPITPECAQPYAWTEQEGVVSIIGELERAKLLKGLLPLTADSVSGDGRVVVGSAFNVDTGETQAYYAVPWAEAP